LVNLNPEGYAPVHCECGGTLFMMLFNPEAPEGEEQLILCVGCQRAIAPAFSEDDPTFEYQFQTGGNGGA